MLNVMLVDDESLVRMGLRHGIPWAEYDMSVAEEAGSVAEAKRIIAMRDDLDLVFADIVMPGENGLELVRWLKLERPMLPVVMLTYHDDFAYIQEALRLGATDYIHKAELEQPGIAATLRRIANVAGQSRANRSTLDAPTNPRYAQALIVVGMPEYAPPEEARCRIARLDDTHLLLLFPEPCDERLRIDIENQLEGSALLLFFDGIEDVRISDMLYCAKLFMNQEYFYRKLPNLRIYELDTAHDSVVRPMLDSSLHRWIEEELASLDWLGDDALFLKILSTIQRCRLSPDTVSNLFFSVQLKWRHVLKDNLDDAPFRRFEYWYQWADWIAGIRRRLMVSSGYSRYSPTIQTAIRHLLVYLDAHFTEDISVSKAAKMSSLSESYFAKCFRDITRKSFHNYLRDMRLAYAQKLLISTHLSVTRVAELSGFPDPFHFSKLFKAQYAMPPGVYRGKWFAQAAAGDKGE